MTVRSRFWLLAALRWLPTGLIVPVVALLPLDRGLSVAELGIALAMQGVVVLCLELPTGGLADALGRKPVFLASAGIAVAAYCLVAVAHDLRTFMLASALMGAFRALDSGPLNAWFVDSVHDDPAVADRAGAVARGLSGYASIVGLSIAAGALLSGALVAWSPMGQADSLALPYWIAAGLGVAQVVAGAVLMTEDRSARTGGVMSSLRATPAVVVEGAQLLRRSRVLRALVTISLLWGCGMVAFESLMPVRLAELLGDRDAAAAVMGPVTAAAWTVSALGAATVPIVLRRWSLVQASVALRILQGVTVVGMGLALGPVGLVLGLLATYALHSAAGAIYETLLHEQVDNRHRATVLSLASMMMHPGGSIGGIVLGAVATGVSTAFALAVGGLVLAAAAPLFLVREAVPAGGAA